MNTDSNRRAFIKRMGTTAVAVGTLPLASILTNTAHAADGVSSEKHDAKNSGNARRQKSFRNRVVAAEQQRPKHRVPHPVNGDQALPRKIGSYSKGLPHDSAGVVDPAAFAKLTAALDSGKPADFAAIPLGGVRTQIDPLGAFSFSLTGKDSHDLTMSAAPSFSSAETAGEMVEMYWHALLRDVAFIDYATNSSVLDACADLSALSNFKGPKSAGQVTPDTLFRGINVGNLRGPYISQFLLKDIPYGTLTITQKYRTTVPDLDYGLTLPAWLALQNGNFIGANVPDATPRYIRNGRDLGEAVHRDFTYQFFLNATNILLGFGFPALNPTNPYLTKTKEFPFINFGSSNILDVVSNVAALAVKASWYQKWLVHLRLRPETFSGRVHLHKTGAANYPIHRDVLLSPVLQTLLAKTGSYFLPLAYAEGSPTHPAYPAAHAAIAGACTTVMKAFFNESFIVPNPVVSNGDGTALASYTGAPLTAGGEMDKLAYNVAIGRDFAGVHWRSDSIEGLKLGEDCAISFLFDLCLTYPEPFAGFTFRKFDGTSITIKNQLRDHDHD